MRDRCLHSSRHKPRCRWLPSAPPRLLPRPEAATSPAAGPNGTKNAPRLAAKKERASRDVLLPGGRAPRRASPWPWTSSAPLPPQKNGALTRGRALGIPCRPASAHHPVLRSRFCLLIRSSCLLTSPSYLCFLHHWPTPASSRLLKYRGPSQPGTSHRSFIRLALPSDAQLLHQQGQLRGRTEAACGSCGVDIG